ncbi:MAG: DUF2946 domain-containing protein [Rubrivivax sp.]|nr:DUF2946 domain-containing protein [Rubrivivax sp.]
MKPRPCRQLISTLALVAVLLNALAPALSQARAASSGGTTSWIEACTAQGARWLQLDDAGRVIAVSTLRPDDAPAALHAAACGYCLAHAASFGLPPPAGPLALATPPGVAAAPQGPGPARPHLRSEWAAPAARAPPGC